MKSAFKGGEGGEDFTITESNFIGLLVTGRTNIRHDEKKKKKKKEITAAVRGCLQMLVTLHRRFAKLVVRSTLSWSILKQLLYRQR